MILDKNKSISVVLGAYNQAHILKDTLKIWLHCCRAYKFGAELIICDDGSNDGTETVLDEFLSMYENSGVEITYLQKDHGDQAELAKNINMSLPHIKGKYTLIAMADSYPNGNLLDHYSDHLASNTVLTGLRTNIAGVFNYSWQTDDYRANTDSYLDIDRSIRPWEGFTGNNFVIPSDLFKSIGGWNESFIGYGGEDWEMAAYVYYLYRTKFLAVPKAKVFHVSHEIQEGSGDPEAVSAKRFYELEKRYKSLNFDREVK